MLSITRLLGRLALVIFAVALMAACGGGSSGVAPAPVVKVEIAQKGLLFTGSGQSSQLMATATDAYGNAQNVPIVWTSNKPGAISVDATGRVTAQVASGAGQIVAMAQGLQSAPLLAIVTAVAPGAVLLKDTHIVGDPVETSPGAESSLNNTYHIALSGITSPAIGAVLINTESKPVGGRVLAVDSSSSPMIVTLQMVPAREMFPTLEIQETIDLSNAEIAIPSDVLALYNMVRTGNTFTFTAKPAASANAAMRANASLPAARRNAVAPTKLKLGIFDCEITATGLDRLPVTLTAPPTFSVTASPTLDVNLNLLRTFGFDRLVINAEPTFAIEAGLALAVGFDGKVECKKEIFSYVMPVGGPLALIIGGVVPMGIGMEAAGKVTAATLGLSAKAEFTSKITAGINCPSVVVFFCEFEGSTKDSAAKFTPAFDLPSFGDIRLEPSLSAFGYLEATIGNVFFKSLRFEFVKAKVGATLAGSFALKESQLADPAYASSYKLSLDASVGTGKKMGAVLQMLGVPDIAAAEIKLSTDIAKSPKGLAAGAVTSDKADFVAGDIVNVTVKLDPTTVDFLPLIGPYNVKRVQLVRKFGTDLTIVPEVASVDAIPGQTEFKLSFTASSAGNTGQLSAFVVSVLAPFDFLSLEVAQVVNCAVVANHCVEARISGALPAQIAGSANLDVTVEVKAENGQFAPAPNTLVDFTPTCATVNPTSGRTNANGVIATTVMPGVGCSSVSVKAVARADVDTTPFAQQTVTALVSRNVVLSGLLTLTSSGGVPGVSLVTAVSVLLTVEVDSQGRGLLLASTFTGTGSETYTYASDKKFNCSGSVPTGSRPPETKSGTVVSGAIFGITRDGGLAQPSVTPTISGTHTTNSCTGGVWTNVTTPFSGSLSNGGFLGTSIVSNGATVAVDFNRDSTDSSGRRTITTGRLE